jgi:hypothetical protein
VRPSLNFFRTDLEGWHDVVAEEGRSIPLGDLAPRLRLGRSIWIVQAFHILRERGYEVRLSDRLDEAAVNVLHADDLVWTPDLWRHFLVTVRADREPAFVSQVEIVQNEASVWTSQDLFIPHWPQPGIIPRDPTRGRRIETVVFMGHAFNLAEEFRSDAFAAELAKLGMRLVTRDDDWWNYGDADVVLAVRDGTDMYLGVKPASKLVNAWLAGCPAILNPEIGYTELRRGPLDYVVATNARHVLDALRTLKSRPELYERMVERGTARVQEFTTERVADLWEEAINGPILERFQAWRERGTPALVRRLRAKAAWARWRLWGTQATQNAPASALRRWANPVRRGLAIPGAFMPGRPGARALATAGSEPVTPLADGPTAPASAR